MRKTSLLLMLLGLAFGGCKEEAQSKKQAAESGKPQAAAEQATDKQEAEAAKPSEETAKGVVEAEVEQKVEKASEGAGDVKKAQEAVKAMAGAPAGAPASSPGPSLMDLAAKEAERRNFTIDHERLMVTFVELWCAKQRGASDREMYDLYVKLDYPPLDMWEYSFMAVSMSEMWCSNAMEKVREKCAPPKELMTPPVNDGARNPIAPKAEGEVAPAPAPTPATAPAPASPAAPEPATK